MNTQEAASLYLVVARPPGGGGESDISVIAMGEHASLEHIHTPFIA